MDVNKAFKKSERTKIGANPFCGFREPGAVWCTTPGMCRKCGWHPIVEEKRKEKIREKYGCP